MTETLNQIPPQTEPLWYAVRTRCNQEKIVSVILENKGYEQFLPAYTATRRWSDRTKKLEVPLFAGYLFCRMSLQTGLLAVLKTPGVISVAGGGRSPLPVLESEIDSVRSVIRSGLATMPWPGLTVGAKVLIEGGPLVGLEGTAVVVDDQYRLVVSITLLQRALSVEIDRRWVRPIPNMSYRDSQVPAVRNTCALTACA